MANILELQIYTKYFISIESDISKCILTTFHGHIMVHQYRIEEFKIDLYFPEYKLAIECDEHNHVSYKNNKDSERQLIITQKLGCKFIRFNPNKKDFNVFILLNDIHMHIQGYNKNITISTNTNELDENQKLKQQVSDLQQIIETQKNQYSSLQPTSPIQPHPSQYSIDQIMSKLQQMENIMLEKSTSSTNLPPPPITIPQKLTTNIGIPLPTLGPRLQKINPDTLTLLKVYESVTECIQEYNNNIKRPSINKAVAENTIYRGFRWLTVDRDLDPNIIHNIEPTREIKTQHIGYIAKLNSEKSEIINVYLDKKTASIMNGNVSASALDNPVKNQTLSHGYYYMLYDECNENIKNDFIDKNNGFPLLYKDGIGVGQYDTEDILVNEFRCKFDCIKQEPFLIGEKTLAKVLDKNILYKNQYYFKTMKEKICI